MDRERFDFHLHTRCSDGAKAPAEVAALAAGAGLAGLPLTARATIAEIGRLGGIPIWAHPGAAQAEALLEDFLGCGLRGLEVLTARRRPSERKRLSDLIAGRRLLVTGGSDWHGHDGNDLGAF